MSASLLISKSAFVQNLIQNLLIQQQFDLFLIQKWIMQGQPIATNLLRNSYGFQKQQSSILRSPNNKTYQTFNNNQPESIGSAIKHLQNKLEGVQDIVRKKNSQVDTQHHQNTSKYQTYSYNNRPKIHPVINKPEEPISQQLLRGSCQEIIKKFDYSNLRNTSHFNANNNFPRPTKEMRRSPGGQNQNTNGPLKSSEIKLQSKRSFLNNSKTPPETPTSKQIQQKPKTPQAIYQYSAKPLTIMKNSSLGEEKQAFKTFAEIQNKFKQKFGQISKSICKKSKFLNGFQIGNLLGKGKFGQVYLARHHETGFIAAIKKTQKQKLIQFKMVDQYVKEIRLHSCLDHPNIVKFYGVFEQNAYIHLVMEYLNGGTLFDHLNNVNCLNIKEAVQYLKDIIEALTYMHDKSIAHRDIKPQNIVISSEGVAKLCDFGWSAVVQTSRKTYCGTFDYAPPQILERKDYDTSVDIWCIGVLTYQLLTGRVPFEGEKRNIIMQKIVNVDKNKFEYPVDLPLEAKQFIECLVQKDPALRPKCQDLLKFKLFTMHLSKGMKAKKSQ